MKTKSFPKTNHERVFEASISKIDPGSFLQAISKNPGGGTSLPILAKILHQKYQVGVV
jgi:hypothetical protein